MDARAEDVWDARVKSQDRMIWNGRFFPAFDQAQDYKKWLWLFEPEKASAAQKKAWQSADRYSFEEMAGLALHEDFHDRRRENRAEEIRTNAARLFSPRSGFSAVELHHVLRGLDPDKRAALLAGIIKDAFRLFGKNSLAPGIEKLALSRIFHSLGSVVGSGSGQKGINGRGLLRAVDAR
ncbi:MAG: hypothetical protein NTU60_06525, partial [Candidatus Aminicenantes bacterium]|nr:hypothetical protein [Candidatus Aminicenantes bacterium]